MEELWSRLELMDALELTIEVADPLGLKTGGVGDSLGVMGGVVDLLRVMGGVVDPLGVKCGVVDPLGVKGGVVDTLGVTMGRVVDPLVLMGGVVDPLGASGGVVDILGVNGGVVDSLGLTGGVADPLGLMLGEAADLRLTDEALELWLTDALCFGVWMRSWRISIRAFSPSSLFISLTSTICLSFWILWITSSCGFSSFNILETSMRLCRTSMETILGRSSGLCASINW